MAGPKDLKVYVTGHNGMVGQALIPQLKAHGYSNIAVRSSRALDLRNQEKVDAFLDRTRPEIVIHLAAKVGGIIANVRNPAPFIYDNLMIQANVIHSAYKNGSKKLVFLGSSCIYPKNAPQPLHEDYVMSGKPEPTNQSYAIAKIAGIQLCRSYSAQYGVDFISLLPCNIYGPGDHYNSENSHVMAALISRFHKAKVENHPFVTVWGSGLPRREFLYVDDLAEAIVFLLENYNSPEVINVGTGCDITIRDLSEKIRTIVGYEGEVVFDKTKPDGIPQKLLDVSKLETLGWKAKTSLKQGIQRSYEAYIADVETIN